MALNYITLQGKLTKDIELKTASNGKTYTIFSIAVQRNYKNQQGKYDADFVDCIASEKIAEHIAKYFHKGSEIIVCGELQTRMYDDQNGQKRKSVLVNINKTYFTSGTNNGNAGHTEAPATAETQSEPTETAELPFEQ